MLDDSLEDNQTLKEFIQLILINFNKGENGLAVKYLRENIQEEPLEKVNQFIETFNDRSFKENVWELNIVDIYRQFVQFVPEYGGTNIDKKTFLVFFMNYVFVSYSNKAFRKAVGITVK